VEGVSVTGFLLPTMARLLWAVALLGAFQPAIAKSLRHDKRWGELKVKHEWTDVPKGWVEIGRPPADYPMKINIGLKQERFDELLGHLYEVSDPDNPRYAPVHAYHVRRSLTRPQHPDTETTFRRRKSTSSLLRVLRPSNPSKLGWLTTTSTPFPPSHARTRVTG
jgi:hypothetical protein